MSLISAPTWLLRARASFWSRRRTTYTCMPAWPSAARAPSSGTRSVGGQRHESRALFGAGGENLLPVGAPGLRTASTLLPESNAQHHPRPPRSQARRRNGGKRVALSFGLRPQRVGRSASARCRGERVLAHMRRRSSRAGRGGELHARLAMLIREVAQHAARVPGDAAAHQQHQAQMDCHQQPAQAGRGRVRHTASSTGVRGARAGGRQRRR